MRERAKMKEKMRYEGLRFLKYLLTEEISAYLYVIIYC